MPTHQDETLQQRYEKEHQDYLKLCGSMTAEQVADLQLHLNNALAREQGMQQLLTAADERADVLEGLLRDLYLSDSLSVKQMPRVHEVFNPSSAALKPAQVSNEKPETIAGHDLACRAVNDYRPGECSHNCKPAAQPKRVPVAVMYADGSVLTKAECGIAFETCCKVETPLYAEQPAPVAVVLPERLVMTDGLHTYEYVTGHNAAIDKMFGVKS